MIRKLIFIAAATAALALPSAASAAVNPCNAGIMNEVTIVPPATLVEGQTQGHHFTVSACTTVTKITTEWIQVADSSKPFMLNAANRATVVPETAATLNPQPDTIAAGGQTIHHYDGRDSWTIPTGQADGHYAVITRYYSDAGSPEAQAASSFSLSTPDLCDNIDGRQQTVPAGRIQNGTSCDLPPTPLPPVVIIDSCPNLDGAQNGVPAGYTLIAGECKIIATPTGKTPTPLLPTPKITKVANVKTTQTGGAVKYTIVTGNTGPGTLLGAVTCDKLPSGTTFVAASKGYSFTNGSICWKNGNVAPGKRITMTVTVKVSASFHGKVLTNTACVTSANAAKRCAKAVVKVKVIRREPVGGVTG